MLLGTSTIVMFAIIIGLGTVGFQVNLPTSEPVGLWRILQLDRPILVGDLFFVCPPVSDVMLEARARG